MRERELLGEQIREVFQKYLSHEQKPQHRRGSSLCLKQPSSLLSSKDNVEDNPTGDPACSHHADWKSRDCEKEASTGDFADVNQQRADRTGLDDDDRVISYQIRAEAAELVILCFL